MVDIIMVINFHGPITTNSIFAAAAAAVVNTTTAVRGRGRFIDSFGTATTTFRCTTIGTTVLDTVGAVRRQQKVRDKQ